MRTKNLLSAGPAIIALWALSIACCASEQRCIADKYTVIALPLLPAGINDSGEIVGTSSSHKAALWTKKRGLREMKVPLGFTNSNGVALNNRGQAIGIAINLQTNARQGFSYKDEKVQLLPGKSANPLAVNDDGVIVGEATMGSNGLSSPVVWKGPAIVNLGGCCGGVATGINNLGRIIGNIYDPEGRYEAYLWDETHGIQHIGPSKVYSSALLLNDAGDVVIQLFSGGVWLRKEGKLTRLELSTQSPNHPRDINNCGAVVGSFGTFHDYYRAFAWDEEGGFRDLNGLIAPNSGWTLQEATSVNNHGEIVGWGERDGSDDEGFLLIPQP